MVVGYRDTAGMNTFVFLDGTTLAESGNDMFRLSLGDSRASDLECFNDGNDGGVILSTVGGSLGNWGDTSTSMILTRVDFSTTPAHIPTYNYAMEYNSGSGNLHALELFYEAN